MAADTTYLAYLTTLLQRANLTADQTEYREQPTGSCLRNTHQGLLTDPNDYHTR